MPRASTPTDDPDTLRFPAAWLWSCSYLAWLPPPSRPSASAVAKAAQGGLAKYLSGATLQAARELQRSGAVHVTTLPDDALAAAGSGMLRGTSPFWEPAIDKGGGELAEVTVTGLLDERMLPLWTSLAAARGIAHAFRGLVVDCGWPRVFPPSTLEQAIPEPPRMVMAEHVLVLSSSDDRDRGRLTTIGMHRLGLPELAVDNVPADSLRALALVVNGLSLHLLELALAAPPARGFRSVTADPEMTVRRAWIDAASGRPAQGEPYVERDAPPPVVRLALKRSRNGEPWIVVGPPRDWRGGRKRWARSLADALGLPWLPPPKPSCGHDSRRWDA